MKVQVLYFGLLRERLGCASERLDLNEGATVADLLDALCTSKGIDRLGAGSLRVAVNLDYVDSNAVLSDNDEVAIIPPVSGGVHVRDRIRTHRSR